MFCVVWMCVLLKLTLLIVCCYIFSKICALLWLIVSSPDRHFVGRVAFVNHKMD